MSFTVGSIVEAHGLKSAVELNGLTGVIIIPEQPNGRFGVRFAITGKPSLLKPDNLTLVDVRAPSAPTEMPVVREEREGMGFCLVAREGLRTGDILLAEKPCDIIPNTHGTVMDGEMMKWSKAEKEFKCDFDLDVVVDHFCTFADDTLSNILTGFESHEGKDRFVQQTLAAAAFACKSGRVPEAKQDDMARYLRILAINAMRIDAKGTSALYEWGSKVAHSCEPNAMYHIIDGGTLMIRAIADIPAGAVVTISYLPKPILLLAPTVLRRQVLETQKEFTCKCERCLRPDTSRILPCHGCTGDCLRDDGGTWTCISCDAVSTDAQMEVAKEDVVMGLLAQVGRDMNPLSLQNLWKFYERAIEAVGHKHFVAFQSLIYLFQKQLQDAVRVLGDEELIQQMKDDVRMFKRRFLAPVLLLFRRLETWAEAHVPTLRYVLLSEAVYKIVNVLAVTGFVGDAVNVVLKYFSLNRAVYGDHDREAQAFRQLLAKYATAQADLENVCLRPGCGETAERRCERCGLAPYCSVPCEARDRSEHMFLCITAKGRMQLPESVPPGK